MSSNSKKFESNVTNMVSSSNENARGNLKDVPDSDNGGVKSPNLWKCRIPSKKRSRRSKRLTPMEKFHKELLDEWVLQGKPNESNTPEEVLLFDNVNNFIPSNEIGLGGRLLLKPDGSSS